MKTGNAIRMLSDLQQLINRWELELDAKPLWWRKYSATGHGEATGPLTTEDTKEIALQRPTSRTNATRSKALPKQRDRSRAKTRPINRASSAAATRL